MVFLEILPSADFQRDGHICDIKIVVIHINFTSMGHIHTMPYMTKHSRGKTFTVHQQCSLCRENFRGRAPTIVFNDKTMVQW